MRVLKWALVLIAALAGVYFLGPRAPKPEFDATLPDVATSIAGVESYVAAAEAGQKGLKPNNASKIVWHDTTHAKTPYAVVYLHGFSASAGEGDPMHLEFAKRYGCNLYLPRLYGHGLVEAEPMLDFTPEKLVASAKDAVAVAQKLGERVILMSTSTGGTLSLYLASQNPDIHALIAYSPNIEVYDPNSKLLTGPWGLQIARLVMGSDYFQFEAPEENQKYWTTKYRIEALVALMSLLENTMAKPVFEAVRQPFFMGYYYKNDSLCDKTVSVPKMLEMYSQLGTPPAQKRKVAFTEVGSHVVCSKYTSKDLNTVRRETFNFAEEVLKLSPVDSTAMAL